MYVVPLVYISDEIVQTNNFISHHVTHNVMLRRHNDVGTLARVSWVVTGIFPPFLQYNKTFMINHFTVAMFIASAHHLGAGFPVRAKRSREVKSIFACICDDQ